MAAELASFYDWPDPLHQAAIRERAFRENDPGLVRAFAERLSGKKILDAGCGTGEALRWFQELGLSAEGVDSSPTMVEAARQRGFTVSCRDLRMLTLARESFDGVWCHRVLELLPIEEAQRVISTFFMALTPAQGMLLVSYLDEAGRGVSEDFDPSPLAMPRRKLHFYRPDAFHSMLRQSGFQAMATADREEGAHRRQVVIARRV